MGVGGRDLDAELDMTDALRFLSEGIALRDMMLAFEWLASILEYGRALWAVDTGRLRTMSGADIGGIGGTGLLLICAVTIDRGLSLTVVA